MAQLLNSPETAGASLAAARGLTPQGDGAPGPRSLSVLFEVPLPGVR